MTSEEDHVENLSKIFQEGLDLFNKIDKTVEPTNSSEIQADIKRTMCIFEKATRLATVAGLFSANESIEEIATADLQYLLLPALLGTLSLKMSSGERKEIIDVAEIYFKDFLQRCNDYSLSDYTFEEQQVAIGTASQFEQLKGMVQTRQTKIQRFKEQKDLQRKLDDLQVNMASKNADEDTKRQHMLTMVKIFILQAIEELASIAMEQPLLVHREQQSALEPASAPQPQRRRALQPVILTRDAAQKAVFGLGYPSLPTMTVREFYDQRVQDGVFPDPGGPARPQPPPRDADAEQRDLEERLDGDDPDALQHMRDRDDFKDDHRRGWGNRMNRS